jgi:hypothetical protein
MRAPARTPDWGLMIEQLIHRGMTAKQIGDAMSSVLTVRMIDHYRSGVQPIHFRGEALITLWCKTLKAQRDALPMAELVRGHRVANRNVQTGPRVQSVPDWPPAPQPSVKPRRKQRGMVEVAEAV